VNRYVNVPFFMLGDANPAGPLASVTSCATPPRKRQVKLAPSGSETRCAPKA
jgi:hypothetical protein